MRKQDIVKAIRGQREVILDALTLQRFTLPHNHKLHGCTIYKRATVHVELGVNYEQRVNERRVIEGKRPNFEAEPLPYGEWLSRVFIAYGRKIYLRTIHLRTLKYSYEHQDGTSIHKRLLAPFEKERIPAKQGLDNSVHVRNYCITSILGIRHTVVSIRRGIKNDDHIQNPRIHRAKTK